MIFFILTIFNLNLIINELRRMTLTSSVKF